MARTATVLLAVVAAGLTLLVVPAGAVAPAAAPHGRYQHQAFTATNEHRAAAGRRDLRAQECVQRFAVRQARRMAEQERMFHQDLAPIVRRCGLSAAGENVAYGYSTGRSVVAAWMRSEGHRRNILNRQFRLLGIGARQSDDGTWYAAQVFGRKAR